MLIEVADRQKAKRIIEDLRRDYESCKIAALLGIPRLYVTYAQHMTYNKYGRFLCPKSVIKKILEYGAMLGFRRTPARTA